MMPDNALWPNLQSVRDFTYDALVGQRRTLGAF